MGAVGLDRPFFSDKNRAFWLLQSFGWSGYLILRYLTGVVNGFQPIVFLFHCLIITATGYSLTLLMAALYKRLIKLQAAITMLVSIATVVLASVLFSFLETWSISTFVNPTFEPRGTQFLGAMVLDFALLAAWTALYYGINYYLLLEEQIDQRRALESQASAAQLAMLRYQLNPHFLFNTLNSISTLVLLSERERANAMLARLSSFLRYTLANEPTAQVPLAKEIDTLKLYLEIEKMRFEERLKPHFRIEAEAAGVPVPSLILQPLIENAIKYAVTPAENGADIWINARREGQHVRIEVSDSGAGGAVVSESQSTGLGLANTRERLIAAYGSDSRFETKTNEKGGFSVILHIPLGKKDEE
ncbi:sensor histidine kinase [Sphingomicrobium aestuariivivum]|uniref:sensor histidine kinase n=1 Tax=Sphingomicrobium aestuariivivum TaxID=1582356 RepID=UPI001FD7190E|nr:histidine kinase [Sphingomicrobium aestuariivivum]MCJ8191387.1 histidine kinase [Sphingomicrobium aestuariivivum]